jgi:hypothetical protein
MLTLDMSTVYNSTITNMVDKAKFHPLQWGTTVPFPGGKIARA